jgi:hypothetical protein
MKMLVVFELVRVGQCLLPQGSIGREIRSEQVVVVLREGGNLAGRLLDTSGRLKLEATSRTKIPKAGSSGESRNCSRAQFAQEVKRESGRFEVM